MDTEKLASLRFVLNANIKIGELYFIDTTQNAEETEGPPLCCRQGGGEGRRLQRRQMTGYLRDPAAESANCFGFHAFYLVVPEPVNRSVKRSEQNRGLNERVHRTSAPPLRVWTEKRMDTHKAACVEKKKIPFLLPVLS
ncbi:hypothetical protein AMECASPLE_009627 [Ameca splendens]|uniref:Uncharacterized protein n=1 Tax=Ameca splendens TaxID=208324 RepID=A0ABV1A6J9_9TELE